MAKLSKISFVIILFLLTSGSICLAEASNQDCIVDGSWSVKRDEPKEPGGSLKMYIFKNSSSGCLGAPERVIQEPNGQLVMIKNGYMLVKTSIKAAEADVLSVYKLSDGKLLKKFDIGSKKVEFDGKNLTYFKTGSIRIEDCPKDKNQGFGCYFTQKVSVNLVTLKEKILGARDILMSQ